MAEGDGEEQSAGSAPESRSTRQSDVGTQNVFISYASADKATADSVCAALEHAKIPCWIAPRDVKPGARYADAIVRAISEANALVLVLSASAIGSDHVAREIERAASKHKQIIAFRIDVTPLSPELEYFLSNSQWIDVPALGMPAALKNLAEAVGQGSTHAKAAASPGAAVKPVAKTGHLAIAAAILVGVGATVALAVHFWLAHHGGTQEQGSAAISDKSIAVLPFVDLSEKKDQEYFADGIAEEVLDRLTKVPMLQGHYEAALAEFRKETLDDGQLEGPAMAHFAAGYKTESDSALAEAIRHNATSWPSEIARVYAFRGEKDHAFEWLDKAYEARDEDLYTIKGDPLFKNLEGDPRYKAFLHKMNLPE